MSSSVQIRFSPISTGDSRDWVHAPGARTRWIITILRTTPHRTPHSPRHRRRWPVRTKHRRHTRASPARAPLRENEVPRAKGMHRVLRPRATPSTSPACEAASMEVSQTEEFGLSLQEDNVFRRCRRLPCFGYGLHPYRNRGHRRAFADRAGVGPQVRAITPAPCAAKSTSASFRRRVAPLEGLDEASCATSRASPHNRGRRAHDGAQAHRPKNADPLGVSPTSATTSASVSDSTMYTPTSSKLSTASSPADMWATSSTASEGRAPQNNCTGREHQHRPEQLRWATEPTTSPMLSPQGLGIAFHAKPKVKQTARQSISTIGLDGVLYFLGFRTASLPTPHAKQTISEPFPGRALEYQAASMGRLRVSTYSSITAWP